MGRQRLRLVLKMVLHQPAGALVTVVLALILVFSCVSVSGFVSAYSRAVERGAQSSFGAYSTQVTGNEDVVSYMRSLQEKGEAVAISHSRQNILTADDKKGSSADVTMISGPADLGVLVSGRYPTNPGEVSVSATVAEQLRSVPGDLLEFVDVGQTGLRRSFTLVGITENPASINEVGAVVISDNEADFASSEVWLTNDDLASISYVLNHNGGNAATVASVIARAHANTVNYQAVSPRVARLFAGLMIAALLVAIYAADRRRRRTVYRVLTALGENPTRAALTTCAQTTLLALSGGVIGWLLAAVSLPSTSAGVAAYFEQRWNQMPWGTMTVTALAVLVMIGIGSGVTVGGTVLSHERRRRTYDTGFSRRVLMVVGITGTVATLLIIASRQVMLFMQGHRVAMIVGAISIPPLAYAIALLTRKRRMITRLGNRLQKLTLAVLAIVFALTYYGSAYASAVAEYTNWQARQIPGEDSFLKIDGANEQAITNLFNLYPELKDRTAVFGDVSTNEQQFRITDSKGAECFRTAKHVDDCPRTNLDRVFIASGGAADSKYIGHAPETYVTTDGTVTLIGIEMTDSSVTQTITVEGIMGDSQLDNNVLRGLIIPKDYPVLEQIGVNEVQSYTAVVSGFASLSDEIRNGVRSSILSQAPFALLLDSDNPENRQLRAQVIARQLFAVIASGTLLLALVVTLVSDQRIERRLIELSGRNRRAQIRLLKPLFFSYTITVTSAVVLGRLVVMDRIPFTHLDVAPRHDYGLVWTAGLAGLLFLLPALVVATRPVITPSESGA